MTERCERFGDVAVPRNYWFNHRGIQWRGDLSRDYPPAEKSPKSDCDGLKTDLRWASRVPADEALDREHRRTNFGAVLARHWLRIKNKVFTPSLRPTGIRAM